MSKSKTLTLVPDLTKAGWLKHRGSPNGRHIVCDEGLAKRIAMLVDAVPDITERITITVREVMTKRKRTSFRYTNGFIHLNSWPEAEYLLMIAVPGWMRKVLGLQDGRYYEIEVDAVWI